jgi:hypothetical protein
MSFLDSSSWSTFTKHDCYQCYLDGKTLGPLLEVRNGEVPSIICRHQLRIKVEIHTSKPLVPGFHFPRLGRDPIWVHFLYECFADYCILCGLIGYKKNGRPAPPLPFSHDKYSIFFSRALVFFFLFFSFLFQGPKWMPMKWVSP